MIEHLEAELKQAKTDNAALMAYKEATESQGENRDEELKAAQDKNIQVLTELESLRHKQEQEHSQHRKVMATAQKLLANIDFESLRR